MFEVKKSFARYGYAFPRIGLTVYYVCCICAYSTQALTLPGQSDNKGTGNDSSIEGLGKRLGNSSDARMLTKVAGTRLADMEDNCYDQDMPPHKFGHVDLSAQTVRQVCYVA